MTHVPELISDLALILISAAITTIVFKWLKQPAVLGYIIAGILVGPEFHVIPTVVDRENITTWADIGVIVLLFSLGLEFSFKKLLKVGPSALVIALMGVGLTILSGYQLGRVLGWSFFDSLFLGGILSIASTTIIIRAFGELGVRGRQFTNTVLGVLVFEDLAAVLLLVILSTVAVSSNSGEGTALLLAISRLGFFLVLWFLWGIFFLPGIFKRLNKYLNDEMLLIISLALCFGMVVFASAVGLSAALGAFVMGSILAETSLVHRIETLIGSVRDLFGAIFFVSVGMLFDPTTLTEYWLPVLLSCLILLVLKPLFAMLGSLLTGNTAENSIRTGMSLSQIGEFSFIIAKLGVTLAVTSEFLYPIAVAVSIVTTFATPYWIRLSEPVSGMVLRALPESLKSGITSYAAGSAQVRREHDWKILLRNYVIYTTLYTVIIIALILLATRFVLPLFEQALYARMACAVVLLILMSPFLWAMAFRRSADELYQRIWSKPAQRGPLVMLIVLRVLIALALLGFAFDQMFSPLIALLAMIIATVTLIAFRHRLKNVYSAIETRFMSNLETKDEKGAALVPWDSHFASITIRKNSVLNGRSLLELQLRERFGVNVAFIERDEHVFAVPTREEKVYFGDTLGIIGTDEQIEEFVRFAGMNEEIPNRYQHPPVLQSIRILAGHEFSGKSIRDGKIRELTHGLIVGLERNGQRHLNPESDTIVESGDVLWIVGDRKRIEVLQRK